MNIVLPIGINKVQSDNVVIRKGKNAITFSIVIQGIEETTKVKNEFIIVVIVDISIYLYRLQSMDRTIFNL